MITKWKIKIRKIDTEISDDELENALVNAIAFSAFRLGRYSDIENEEEMIDNVIQAMENIIMNYYVTNNKIEELDDA